MDLPMLRCTIHGLILTPSGHEIPVESRVFYFAVRNGVSCPDLFGISHADPE
jgi:hypothetical protein